MDFIVKDSLAVFSKKRLLQNIEDRLSFISESEDMTEGLHGSLERVWVYLEMLSAILAMEETSDDGRNYPFMGKTVSEIKKRNNRDAD